MKRVTMRVSAALTSCAALLLAASCGGGDENGDGDNGGNGAAGSGSGGGLVTGGSGAIGSGGLPAACQPSPDDAGCVGAAYEGENIPLDIYVMFDMSCSMSCTVDQSGCCRGSDNEAPVDDWRITPVRAAMTAFLQDPASAGISVGLGFFGDHDLDQNEDPEVCSVEGHSDSTVDISLLPTAADPLMAALNAALPQGGTPTHYAIDGACAYVDAWATAHPGRKVVILLVTDGIPEYSCNADIGLATDAAETCFGAGEGFQTYVLGVTANNNGNSTSLDQLNQIAVAGGTSVAYLTDTADVQGSMLEALNAIRADAVIPCELSIPDPPAGEVINYSMINLGICDAVGAVQTTPYVETPDACADGPGWYYDDPSAPGLIHLCEVTCDTVSVPGASLFFSLGCATQTEIR